MHRDEAIKTALREAAGIHSDEFDFVKLIASLDAAGYVIVPKEPTTHMLFGTKTNYAGFSLDLRKIWREMIDAYHVGSKYD